MVPEELGMADIEASRPELFNAFGEWMLALHRRRPKQEKRIDLDAKEKETAQPE